MKKNLKRTLAKVMVFALTVTLAGTATDADAAKKIKLSKKSITITKGKSKKVTIKNVKAKKVKKLTVKSNKKKIATVKKTGNKKTAFKVTGKKKGSAKITVTVKVKGKKKATKLTLKVKVKNAAVKKTNAPATNAPATNAPASNAPASNAPASNAPATNAPTNAPTQAPTNVPKTPAPTGKAVDEDIIKAGVWNIDLNNETVATKDKDAYRTDVEYGEDGSVTFTNAAEYNGGMVFGLDDETNAYDLTNTGFKYVRVELVTDQESSLKGFNDASSWWNKIEVYEGNTTPAKERVIYYDLQALADTGLEMDKVQGFGIGFQGGSTGATITLKSMSLVKEKDKEPVVVETPDVEIAAGSTKIAEGETTSVEVAVETGTVESVKWSVDTAAVEVAADKNDATKATVTAVAAGKATVTAEVTVTRDGQTFVIEKSVEIAIAKAGDIIYNASMAFVGSEAAELTKTVGESASVEVTVDKGEIEKVEFSVDSKDAVLVSNGAKAEVSSKKVGAVTVTAKVYVKGSSIVDEVSKTINYIPATVTMTGDELGEKASYTVAGAGQYAEYGKVTIASGFTPGSTVKINFECTGNVNNTPMQWKLTDGANSQYTGSLSEEFTLSTDKFDGTKDVTIVFQATAAGFAGTCKFNSVTVADSADNVTIDKAEDGFTGITQYTETALVDLASKTDLADFNKVTIEYTAVEGADLYASLHTTKGKFQYSDVAKTGGDTTGKLVLDLSDATVKANIGNIIADAENNGTLVLGLKLSTGKSLASGSVEITKVIFEG